MDAPSNLTPSEAAWARFYVVLHQEVLKLEALAKKKTVTNGSASETSPKVTVSQRRPKKASANRDSNPR